MGKKQILINRKEQIKQRLNKVKETDNKKNVNNEQDKISKTQRRKLRRKQKRQKLKNKTNQATNQIEIQQSNQIENQIQQVNEQNNQNNQNEELISQSLIQISSSQQPIQMDQQNEQNNQNDYDNQVQFNKGKQGFQDLIDQKHSSNQLKHITITRQISQEQKLQLFYIYHIKKNTFYKTTSLTHQKLNTTHLNQNITLKIIDQNLLKYANKSDSTQFLLNGKLIQRQIQFIKSTVFKIVTNQNTKKINLQNTSNKKKSNIKNLNSTIKQNLQKFIKPTKTQQLQQIIQLLRDFQWNQDCLLISKQKLHFVQTTPPFSNLDSKILQSNHSLLILGKKNTGKSTLAEYIKNTNKNDTCILDCDIGRSLSISGCVSLITKQQTINIWIGQFTPFNCIKTYIRAIKQLYLYYRQKYFTNKLIINTMGYLSGLGQIIIYQIYNLIHPQEIIIINNDKIPNGKESFNDNIGNIIRNIKTGVYLTKLLTIKEEQFQNRELKLFSQKNIQLNTQYISNQHAQSKGIPVRFQNLLTHQINFKNIIQLIKTIKSKQLQSLPNIPLYTQDKLGSINKVDSNNKSIVNMRIVLIGKLFNKSQNNLNQNQTTNESNQPLFRVFGIGYGYEGKIYFSQQQIQTILSPNIKLKQQIPNLIGILNQGVDFQKNFYLINQLTLIDFQLQYGSIPYILPVIKGMGSKGTRNNPSKNA